MANIADALAKGLLDAVDEKAAKETKAYDTSAEIRNIKDGVAWVHIPGGVDETPVALTINAQVGDQVQVRVSGGRAWITGNATNPPTDDTRANMAYGVASNASELSAIAAQAATDAQTSAIEADKHAGTAEESANIAQNSANSAIQGLGLVERVVDVVNWIAKHGKYALTTDETVDPDKHYFTYDSATDTYAMVTTFEEGDNPSEKGWYEVESIDEAVSNFINTHLVLLNDRLILQNGNERIEFVPETGMQLYSENNLVATYGSESTIGDQGGFHLKATPTELGFYDGTTRVAYIDGKKLYITQSVVLEQMDVGRRTGEINPAFPDDPTKVGKGQWSWKVHVVQGANNLYLKWLG